MLFSTIASVFSAILMTQSTLAALTPQQVVDNINILAAVSANANAALSQLTTTTPPAQVVIIGQALGGDVNTTQAAPPFPDGVTQPIVDALGNGLLSTVMHKHSIFAQFGVTAPILNNLRNLGAGIDSFALTMTDVIPTRRDDVKTDKDQLDQSVGNSISRYQQVCIPSPLYPKVLPLCAPA
ncbi:hypothetical protein BYT27DRAFT_7082424 [Phlegmacium glaucopus]|nr:hypothetical protein BYT27DRAFT_7082424 [Phlegmacium glaucopus]